MSLIHNIDYLARQPGVLAILVDDKPNDGGDLDFRGADLWRQPLADTLALSRSLAALAEFHVAAGLHTIVVQSEGGQVVAIVIETGHAIRKSLRRMIRRYARAGFGDPISPEPTPAAMPSFGEPVDSSDLRRAGRAV